MLFLQAVVKRGRQQLLREIATEYATLLDVKLNRVRAGVTLARPANEALQKSIAEALSRHLGKEVLPVVLGRSGDPGRRGRPGGRADPRRLAPAAAGEAAEAFAGEVARRCDSPSPERSEGGIPGHAPFAALRVTMPSCRPAVYGNGSRSGSTHPARASGDLSLASV